MIDLFTLLASLRETVWLRKRRYSWAKRSQERLIKMNIIFEDKKEINRDEAIEYLRLFLQVEANTLLRDNRENGVFVTAENAPLTYQIFRNDRIQSLLDGMGGGE